MQLRKRSMFAVLMVLVFSMMVCSSAFAADKVIKIGALFPLTGPAAVSGQNCVNAVLAAADVINKANPDINAPLAAKEGLRRIQDRNNQGRPPGKTDVAKSESMSVFTPGESLCGDRMQQLSHKTGECCCRARKEDLHVRMLELRGSPERDYKYFFRHAPTDAIESKEFVDYIEYLNKEKKAGIKTLGVIYENTEFGKHAAEEAHKAAKAIGLKVVADVPFNNGATNLNSEVQTLKAANPDAVFGAALGGDYSLWVRTMKQVNWLPKIALNYCTGYQNPAVQKELAGDGDHFMGGMGYSPALAKEFMPEAIKIEKKYYTPRSNQPFDSDSIQEGVMLFVLAQAIEKAGSLDTEKVVQLLRTEEFPSVMSLSGKVKFEPGGQNVYALSVITQIKDQDYKTVFPLKYKKSEPVFPMTPWDKR